MSDETMGIRVLAERTGATVYTLRYYERAGLMPPVPRDERGRRVYSERHVRWVRFLLRLREAGMPIREVRRYAELTLDGVDPDGAERMAMLRAHREEVREKLERLREHLEILDDKVARGCAPEPPSQPPEEP